MIEEKSKIITLKIFITIFLTSVLYNSCTKSNLEDLQNGGNQTANTEFEDGGDRDHSLTINPEPSDCGDLLATIPEQTKPQIFENLDILAQTLTEISNDADFVSLVKSKCAEQFDEDYNVLFRDLKAACANDGTPLPPAMDGTAGRLCPQQVQNNLARASEDRYHWDGDIIYPQIFIPFFEQVQGMNKTPIIAPFDSEDVYDIGATITGYRLVFDNGNTDSIIDIVNTSISSGQKKNALINASPLSDDVLSSALNAGLPNGHTKQIFQANAPYSDDITTEITASSLPNGIKNQILNAPDVVKFETITVTKELAQTYPVWVVGINDNVNCQGIIAGEKLPDEITAECAGMSERRWFEFFPTIMFKYKNESWAGGKGNVKFSWVRYDPFDQGNPCEAERKEKLVNVGTNDLCEDIEVHLEFCNSTWMLSQEIALLVYERDALAKERYWDYTNGFHIEVQTGNYQVKWRSKQLFFFVEDNLGSSGSFNWGSYPTPGQWGGTTTSHTSICTSDYSDDCFHPESPNGQHGLIYLRGGREGA